MLGRPFPQHRRGPGGHREDALGSRHRRPGTRAPRGGQPAGDPPPRPHNRLVLRLGLEEFLPHPLGQSLSKALVEEERIRRNFVD